MAGIVRASLAVLLLLPVVRTRDPPLRDQPREPVSLVCPPPSSSRLAGVSASPFACVRKGANSLRPSTDLARSCYPLDRSMMVVTCVVVFRVVQYTTCSTVCRDPGQARRPQPTGLCQVTAQKPTLCSSVPEEGGWGLRPAVVVALFRALAVGPAPALPRWVSTDRPLPWKPPAYLWAVRAGRGPCTLPVACRMPASTHRHPLLEPFLPWSFELATALGCSFGVVWSCA